MHHRRITIFGVWLLLLAAWSGPPVACGQENPVGAPAVPDSEPTTDELALHILEQALLRDYDRFEEKLLELAEYTRSNDPDRANLLLRTRSESTSRRVQAQMQRIAEALAPTDSGDVLYGDALTRQEELLADLAELLKLLQSEDERDRLEREIARLKDLIKDTDRLIGDQKDVRADTERGGDGSKLCEDQQNVAGRAAQLAEKIDRQDADRQAEENRDPSSNGESPQSEEQKEQPEDAKDPSERKSPDELEIENSTKDPKSAEEQPQEGQQSEDAQPSEGQGEPQSEGSQQESQKGQQQSQKQQGQNNQNPQQQQSPSGEQQTSPQSQSERTPGREQLEEARERMERAIEELQQRRLDKASDEQDAALAKLEEMKAELEEILRQLREEERKLFLMALEARFQRMLQRQLDINNGTLKLARIPEAERDADRHLGQATKWSRREGENVTDAEKALMLLREEGSSVAFPEAVEMMRDNMQAVVRRLQRGDTGETTQLLERMIVESLEEMVFALQREMEKQDEQQQQAEQQQGEPTDPNLVDTLAEMKMIRSLQSQVNRLTRQYGLEIDGEQATDPEDLAFLRNLALRQERIHSATYDLSIGKNR